MSVVASVGLHPFCGSVAGRPLPVARTSLDRATLTRYAERPAGPRPRFAVETTIRSTGTGITLTQPACRTVIFPASASGAVRPSPVATIRTYDSGAWRDPLRAASSNLVVLDPRCVSVVDRNSMAVAARAHRAHRSFGGAVRLVEPPRSVHTLARLAESDDLPTVIPAVEAVAA